MADAYKIVITSQGGGSSAPKNPIAGDNNQSKPTSNEEEKNKDIGVYVAYKKYVSPFLKKGLQYQISTVALRTGNSERQQRLQSAFSITSQLVGIGESIYVGAKVGGAKGAVIAAAISTATAGINLVQQSNTLILKEALENQTINMLNVRSGAVNGNRR